MTRDCEWRRALASHFVLRTTVASAVVAETTNECYGQCNFMDTLPPCGQPANAFKDSNGAFLNTNQNGELSVRTLYDAACDARAPPGRDETTQLFIVCLNNFPTD